MVKCFKVLTPLVVVFMIAGCGSPVEVELATSDQQVVYGNDDRKECNGTDSVALFFKSDLDMSDPTNVRVIAPTLQEYYYLCPGERFPDQPTGAYCSGTLIDDDLVLTAGHCVTNRKDCRDTSFVFNYAWAGNGLGTITSADVFSCKRIVVREQTAVVDFGIIQLDRPATPRFTPRPVVSAALAVSEGTPLTVEGYPTGLPCKYDDGGEVWDGRASMLDYFVANLDTFGGNSGSGVYDGNTLVGILVRGEADYVPNYDEGCYEVHVCPDYPSTGCMGEESTYAFRAIDAFCAANSSDRLCGSSGPVCGNGDCEPGEDENNCPEDCGGSTGCGNGVCESGEDCTTCPDDCPSRNHPKFSYCCGDGICSAKEAPVCPIDCP